MNSTLGSVVPLAMFLFFLPQTVLVIFSLKQYVLFFVLKSETLCLINMRTKQSELWKCWSEVGGEALCGFPALCYLTCPEPEKRKFRSSPELNPPPPLHPTPPLPPPDSYISCAGEQAGSRKRGAEEIDALWKMEIRRENGSRQKIGSALNSIWVRKNSKRSNLHIYFWAG